MSVISEKAIDLVLDLLRAAGVTEMKGNLPDADVKLMCYIAELESRAEKAEAMVERLIEVFEKGKYIRLIPDPEINKIQEWAYKLKILVTEWKEREGNGN